MVADILTTGVPPMRGVVVSSGMTEPGTVGMTGAVVPRVGSLRGMLLLWFGVFIIFSAQNITGALAARQSINWQWDVLHEGVYWGVWAGLTPFITRQATWLWIESGAGSRSRIVHAIIGVVIAIFQVALTYLLHGAGLVLFGVLPGVGFTSWIGDRGWSIAVLSFTGVIYYWAIIGVYYSFAYRRMYFAQRAETAEATLDALRRQLQPHFLFNTLNSAVTLIDEAPVRAAQVLRHLSDLLRTMLGRDIPHVVPLAEELTLLDAYLTLQRVRFEGRLRVTVKVDPVALRALVPWMLLQPLVENAIRFAVEPRSSGGSIVIEANRSGEDLMLTVNDDGMTAPGIGGRNEGVGLSNTRARLNHLYGDSYTCTAAPASGDEAGFQVWIGIPYRTRNR